MINLKTTERTGKVVAIKSVVPGDQLMVITRNGVINRQRIDEIRVIGRATQGVRLVNLDENDSVMDVARVIPDPANGEGPNGEGPNGEGPNGEGPNGEGPNGEGTDAQGTASGEDETASADSGAGDTAGADAVTEGE